MAPDGRALGHFLAWHTETPAWLTAARM